MAKVWRSTSGCQWGTRQGSVESVGRFMMQYNTTVMRLSEVTDLALESYMQNALITLTHFR